MLYGNRNIINQLFMYYILLCNIILSGNDSICLISYILYCYTLNTQLFYPIHTIPFSKTLHCIEYIFILLFIHNHCAICYTIIIHLITLLFIILLFIHNYYTTYYTIIIHYIITIYTFMLFIIYLITLNYF